MATTIRLPEGLQQVAISYAARAGVSLNGLISLALREYMQAHAISEFDGPAVPAASVRASSVVDEPFPPAGGNRAERRRAVRSAKKGRR